MTTLSKLSFQEKGHGLFKKKERHAQESMVRKKVGHMKVQVFKRKKERVGHLKVQVFKKRERERERERAHVQRKKRREMVHEGSLYTIHTKYSHTCTSWLRFMTCFSFGSDFWLSNIWGTCMPSTFSLPWAPHKSLSRGRRKRRQQFAMVRKPKSKKRDLREQTEELGYVWF